MYIINLLHGLYLFVFLCYVRKLYNQYHQDHHHHHPLQEHVYLFLSTSAPGRCPSVAADMARGLIIRIIFFKSTFVFVLDLPVESSGILLLLFGHFQFHLHKVLGHADDSKNLHLFCIMYLYLYLHLYFCISAFHWCAVLCRSLLPIPAINSPQNFSNCPTT